jgi:hypothetical protein
VPDDPDSRAEGDLVASYQPGGGGTQLTGPLAAGGYKIRIDGSMNLYRLTVTLTDFPILPDMFEPNNSFEQATAVRLYTPGTPPSKLGTPFVVGAGRYPLTIHDGDRDLFHIRVDPPGALPMTATARLSDSDLPLDVVLYNADRTVAKHQPAVRRTSVELPLSASCYLEISASAPTRYILTLQYEVDQSHLPGPLQDEVVIPLPDLGDPPFVVGEQMQHFLVDLTRDRRTLNRLVFGAATGGLITAELLNSVGAVVARGAPQGDGMHESTAIETGHLDAGTYVLRLGRGGEPSQATGASLHLERLPALAART